MAPESKIARLIIQTQELLNFSTGICSLLISFNRWSSLKYGKDFLSHNLKLLGLTGYGNLTVHSN